MDGLEFFDGHAGVDLGRIELHMAEHLLDETNIRSSVVHGRRHRVAKQVTASFHDDAGLSHVSGHQRR